MSPIGNSTLTLALLFLLTLQSNAKCQKYLDSAKEAAGALQSKYWNGVDYGSVQPIWISGANAFYLNTLDRIAGTSDYTAVMDTVFNLNRSWIDNGEDFGDVQWVSIAYGRNNDVGNQIKYYDIATSALDSTYCRGGLFWRKARDYKNAITSELYITTSSYLWQKTGDAKYLTALKDIWAWLRTSKMRGENGLFNDGLTKDGNCDNNGGTQWTYNQAALLPGLGFLANTGDSDALKSANGIVDAVIANLQKDGALVEACDSEVGNACSVNQAAFKGITVYFISWFQAITNTHKYDSFIHAQADKVLENAALGGGLYGHVWYTKGSGTSASGQGSALGALVGAAWTTC